MSTSYLPLWQNLSETIVMDRNLAEAIILSHAHHPRNCNLGEDFTHTACASNPSCGDEVTIQFMVIGETIKCASFTSRSCALCTASASILTEHLTNISAASAMEVAQDLSKVMRGHLDPSILPTQELQALAEIRSNALRIRCVMIAWEAMQKALAGTKGSAE